MGDHDKTNEDLINELQELQQAYHSLKAVNETDRLLHKRTEEELRASEERFQLLFNKAPLGYQSLDFDGNFIEVNQQWLDILGYEREEVIGKWFGDFLTPAFKDGFRLRFPIFKAQGKIHSEFEMVHKNGSVLFIAFDGRIGYDLNGEFKQMHCILQDITQRKQAEEKLRESVEEYRNLIEFSPIAMSIIHDWKTIYFNPAAVDLFGAKTQDELLGKHIFEFIHTHFHGLAIENAKLLAEKGYVNIQEQKYLKLDGTVLDVETQAKSIRFNDDAATLVVINDITERKKAEKKLIISEERYALAIDVSEQGIWDWNVETNEIFYSEQWKKQIGYDDHELKDDFNTWVEHLHPDEKEYCQNAVSNYLNHPVEYFILEFRFRHKDGSYRWIHNKAASLKNNEGKVIRLFGTHTDITERKLSEAIFKDIVEKNPMSIQILNMEGFPIQVNTAHTNLFGVKPPADYSVLKDPQLLALGFVEFFERIKKGEVVYFPDTYYNVHKVDPSFPDSPLWVKALGFILNDNNGNPNKIVLMHENITERKNAEALLNDIIENNPMSIQIVDKEGYTLRGNPAFIQLFGAVPPPEFSIFEDLKSKSTELEDLVSQVKNGEIVHLPDIYFNTHDAVEEAPDIPLWIRALIFPLKNSGGKPERFVFMHENITDRKIAEQELIKAKEKAEQSEAFLTAIIENQPGLIWLKDVNGKFLKTNTKFLNSCGLSTPEQLFLKTDFDIWPKNLAEKYTTDDFQVIHSKKSLIVEEPIIDKGIDKWFETFKTPIVDDKGNVIGTTGFSFEITERKKAELEIIAAKEKAEESDRLKSAFLANMSHEIRTPLNSIIGFSDLLVDPDFEVEQKMEFINMMRSSSNNLLAIINDIIDISKIETGQVTINKKQFLLEELIKEIVEENSLKAIEKGIDLRIRFADQGTSIALENDPARIKQILTNFVNNAIKFTEQGYVEIGFAEINGSVQIQIKDTGIGIPTQYHEQIFERFRQLESSLTRKHGGNGLGLCISKQLAHLLDCKLWLESEPGKGSTFYLSAPKF